MAYKYSNRCNSYQDNYDVQTICNTVSACATAIRVCDKCLQYAERKIRLNDGKNIRTGKWPSPSATVWEMRQALGWSGNQDIDKRRYKGTVDQDGNVQVVDRLEHKIYPISVDELDRRQAAQFGMTGMPQVKYAGGGVNIGMGNGASTMIVKTPGIPGGIPVETDSKLGKLLGALTGVAMVTAVIAQIVRTITEAQRNSESIASVFGRFGQRLKNAAAALFKSKNEVETTANEAGAKQESKEVVNSIDNLGKKVDELIRLQTKINNNNNNGYTSKYDILKAKLAPVLQEIKKAQAKEEQARKRAQLSLKHFRNRKRERPFGFFKPRSAY